MEIQNLWTKPEEKDSNQIDKTSYEEKCPI